MSAVPCARCASAPLCTRDGAGAFFVYCGNCYDGAPDSSTRGERGAAFRYPDAVEAWNVAMELVPDEVSR